MYTQGKKISESSLMLSFNMLSKIIVNSIVLGHTPVL